MEFKLVFLLVGILALVSGDWQDILPWQAKTTLLELSEQFSIHSIREDPKPLYRHDLPDNYKAYWYIPINTDEYVIISSSPKTGDYKLVIQGSSPSLLEELDSAAERKNETCNRYFMLTPTPDVEMSCQTVHGDVIYAENGIAFTDEELHSLDKLWENQKQDVTTERIWDQSILNKDQNASYYQVVGDHHMIVVGDNNDMAIQAMDDGNISLVESQTRLCELLKICQSENLTRIDPTEFSKTKYGQIYIDIKRPNIKEGSGDYFFEVTGRDGGEFFGRQLMISSHPRSKRASSWTYYSIDDESYFPDYNQHDYKCWINKGWWWGKDKRECCAVGCGPVAWAMILGYYDRRAHSKPVTYGTGSQSLFNCGSDATSGSSSCRAPSFTTPTIKKLTEKLGRTLGTFCLFEQGATTQGNMRRFDRYFNKNQKSGRPSVTVHTNGAISFVGIYQDSIRDKALEYLRAKWPVVVGIRVSHIFSQHYPVATRYRTRTKRECKKFLFWTSCKNVRENDMYLHMGWGGNSNGWRAARMFMAGVARY